MSDPIQMIMDDRAKKLRKVKGTNYYYDFGTANKSFTLAAHDLKSVGVKNCAFMLTLYNPYLIYVDPYDPNITDKEALAVLTECVINPWYFLREVSRIPQEGAKPVPFRLQRASLAQIWCFLNGIDSYITIARQIGKTISAIAIILWSFLFGTNDSEILFLNINQEKANKNLASLKKQRDALPEYLQNKYKIIDIVEGKIDKGTDNKMSITCPLNNNKIVTGGKATSKEKAMEIGRGASQPIQLIDEVEFILWIGEILKAAGPAFVTSSTNARNNNAIYGRVFCSTPGDLDSASGKDAQEIVASTYKWTNNFYDMDINKVKEIIKLNSKTKIVYIEYPYYLLGKDREWYLNQCSVLLGDKIAIKREILLKRIHGSSLSPYSAEDLDALDGKRGSIKSQIFVNGLFAIDLYDEINIEIPYLLGLDISDGYGQDATAMVIVDPFTLKNVGEFKSPYMSPTQLEEFVFTVMTKHFPRGILIPERNRGAALISAILEKKHLFPIRRRLYFTKKDDMDTESKLDRKGFMVKQALDRKKYGVWTGAKSREEMFKILELFIRTKKDCIVLNGLIDEIMTLVVKNGKIQAMSEHHDDIVMAYLMALYVWYYANNLHLFGLDKSAALGVMGSGLNQFDEEETDYKEQMKEMGFNQQYTKTVSDDDRRFNEYVRKLQQEANRKYGISTSTEGASVKVVDGGDYDMDMGHIDSDFFDEMNGFGVDEGDIYTDDF